MKKFIIVVCTIALALFIPIYMYSHQREPNYVFHRALEQYVAPAETFLTNHRTELEELIALSEVISENEESYYYYYELHLAETFIPNRDPVPAEMERICQAIENHDDSHYSILLRNGGIEIYIGSEEHLEILIAYHFDPPSPYYAYDLSVNGWVLDLLYVIRS